MYYYTSHWKPHIYRNSTLDGVLLDDISDKRMRVLNYHEKNLDDIAIVNLVQEHSTNITNPSYSQTEINLRSNVDFFVSKGNKIIFIIERNKEDAKILAQDYISTFKNKIIVFNTRAFNFNYIVASEQEERTRYFSFQENFSNRDPLNKHFRHLFVCINRMVKHHRIVALDVLQQKGIFNLGKTSFSGRNYSNLEYDESLCNSLQHLCTHWKIVPLPRVNLEDYDDSWIDLVSETHEYAENYEWITEKTVRAFLYGKPFLIFGPKGIHKKLITDGFEMFEELFDYSFDIEDDTRKRYEMLVDNIVGLKDTDYETRKKLTSKIYDKLLHNQRLAIDIIQNYKNYTYMVDKSKNFNDSDIQESLDITNHVLDNIIFIDPNKQFPKD